MTDYQTEGTLTRHGLRRPRCYEHESFERAERRKFREDRDRFDLAISMARSAIEDAGFGADALKDFDGHISDHCGDFWNVDPRGED
ncbi:MAG: hypothetical protein KF895_03210 [Parvibaculum sp.]|nr:hypothetical protein [Parvibaculum sp.]